MLLLLELGIVVALFIGGCWSKRVAVVFLPVTGVSLLIFTVPHRQSGWFVSFSGSAG